MTIAQLTHMRPREGKLDEVAALVEAWGEATKDADGRPPYSFLCQDEDHLFVVSLHESAEAYAATADANAPRLERLMPLLVEGQGPTYYGEVLAQQGSANGADFDFPAALRIGRRH